MSKHQYIRKTGTAGVVRCSKYSLLCVSLGLCVFSVSLTGLAQRVNGESVTQVRSRAKSAAEAMRSGDELLRGGHIADACKAYRKSLDLLSSWWLPHLALVRCGRMLGESPAALLEHARYAARARPKIPATHLQLALTLEETGKAHEAIDALKAALTLRPDFFEASFRLGMLYAKHGKHTEAIQHLNNTILAYPGHVVSLNTLADLHLRKGHIDAALSTLRQLLLHSHYPRQIMGRIGNVLRQNGRIADLSKLRSEWHRRFGSKK